MKLTPSLAMRSICGVLTCGARRSRACPPRRSSSSTNEDVRPARRLFGRRSAAAAGNESGDEDGCRQKDSFLAPNHGRIVSRGVKRTADCAFCTHFAPAPLYGLRGNPRAAQERLRRRAAMMTAVDGRRRILPHLLLYCPRFGPGDQIEHRCGGPVSRASVSSRIGSAGRRLRWRALRRRHPRWAGVRGPPAAGLEGNGRSCADCHMPTDHFQLSPASADKRFRLLSLLRRFNPDADDPLFRPVDADDFRTNGDECQRLQQSAAERPDSHPVHVAAEHQAHRSGDQPAVESRPRSTSGGWSPPSTTSS